jgi:hypothetical protein
VLDRASHPSLAIRFGGKAIGKQSAPLTFFADQGAKFGGPVQSFSYELDGVVAAPEPATLASAGLGGLILPRYALRRRRAGVDVRPGRRPKSSGSSRVYQSRLISCLVRYEVPLPPRDHR